MNFFINPRTCRDLGWPQMLDALASRTQTVRGREHALSLPFLDERSAIALSLGRISEARTFLQAREIIPVAAAEDVRAALQRAVKQAVLSASEVLMCGRLMGAAAHVRSFLLARRDATPLLWRLAQTLPELNALRQDIDAAIEPSGTLRDQASPALAQLRARALRLHAALKERIEGLMQDAAFATNMQDTYFSVRGDRYVLPINASFQSKVPGIVHNASQSGHTVFIEPQELVPLGNELAIAESLIVEEERRILALFSAEIGAAHGELTGAIERLAELDCIQASAQLAQDLDATVPELADAAGMMRLRKLRHPRLLLQGKPVVPNHVSLAPDQAVLVISGPNAGGKTATLTGVGLCVLLTRAGLPSPVAEGSVVPLAQGVHCAIGDAQDLSRGLSTFSAHLEQLRDVTEKVRRGWLVLIDEIAADTDPHEGAALARATLEELVERQAQVLVTTHLEEIKALGVTDPRFVNARVGFDAASLKPTYRLEIGAAGASNALAVAAQVGLPARLLKRARSHLQESGLLSAALARLHDTEHAAAQTQQALQQELAAVQAERAQLVQAQQEAAMARRTARTAVLKELADELTAARQQVAEYIAEIQAKPSMRRAHQMQQTLQNDAQALRQTAFVAPHKPPTVYPLPVLRPGMWVKVLSLAQTGEILQLDADSAQVSLGSLRARFRLDDLQPTASPGKKAARHFPGGAKKSPESVAASQLTSPQSRCDVRGMRADDALREIDRFLDAGLSQGTSSLAIVHGLGTGALRKVVRELLGASPYVENFRSGERHEGGDGVTVVNLATT